METHPISEKVIAKLIKVIQSIITVHSIYLIRVQRENISTLYVLDNKKECSEADFYTLTILIINREHIVEPKEFMNKVFNRMVQKVR